MNPRPPTSDSTTFLLDSLRDLEAEKVAGDISEDDYQALRDDYTRRAARSIKADRNGLVAPVPARRKRSTRQWVISALLVCAIAGIAGVSVAQYSGQRQAGEGITGGVVKTPTGEASRCIALSQQMISASADVTQTLDCYAEVLKSDPQNAVAHTYRGWTLYLVTRQSGAQLTSAELSELLKAARVEIETAIRDDPKYPDARAFAVVLAANEGRFEDAEQDLAAFDRLEAPNDMRQLVDGIRQEVTDGLAGKTGG